MLLGSDGGRFVRLWRCCLLSVPLGEQASGRRWDCSGLGHVARRCFGTKWYGDVPGARSTRDGDTGNEDNSSFVGIAQAWATWPEGASAPNGTVMCRGHGVPEMVTPAMKTTAVLFGFLNLTNAMFSFAMTSGLASDSDKFKIIITWPEGASAPNGTVMCRGHGVPEMVTPAMKTTAVLFGFLNLTNAMFSFAMTSGLASDSDKFKIIITWPEGASAPNGTVMCRGHGVPEMVTPAMKTTAVFCSVF